jgi:hypothetical protein
MELRQKRLWRSRHGRRRSHIGFDAAFASGHRPVALREQEECGNVETANTNVANYQCRHSNWLLCLGIGNTSTLAHFFPCFGAVAA